MHLSYFTLASTYLNVIGDRNLGFEAERLKLTGSIISLFAAIISLFLLVVGFRIANELKKRGLDVICSFHARLKSCLGLLVNAASINPTNMNEIDNTYISTVTEDNSHISVYLQLCSENVRSNIINGLNGEPYYGEERFKWFKEFVARTLDLFSSSNDQLPLSDRMQGLLNKLHSDIVEILSYEHETHSKYGSKKEVYYRHEEFINNINAINQEIHNATHPLMSNFWNNLRYLTITSSKVSGE